MVYKICLQNILCMAVSDTDFLSFYRVTPTGEILEKENINTNMRSLHFGDPIATHPPPF